METTKDITPQLVNLEGAAALLSCSTRTVQKLAADGVLPVVKLPGSRLLRFRPSAIAQALAKFEVFRTFPPFDDGAGKVAA